MKALDFRAGNRIKPLCRLPVALARYGENLGAPRPAPPKRVCAGACGERKWWPELEFDVCPGCRMKARGR